MSIRATPKISNQSFGSVSKIDNSLVKFKSKFSPPFSEDYPGLGEKEINDQGENKKSSPSLTASENDNSGQQKTTKPEIFKLLIGYHFKDFFQLSLSKDDFKLIIIIKKSREVRGISQSHPLTNEYTENNDFIKKGNDQYLRTGRFMEGAPGKSYTGVL